MKEKEPVKIETKNAPEIIVKKDVDYDIDLINRNFNNPDAPYFRERILYFYKTLELKLENSDDPDKLVEEYFREIYANKEQEIDRIVDESRKIIEELAPASLQALASLMDWDMKKNQGFTAIPTLLPYSPFYKPVFNFSIVGQLFFGYKNRVLNTAIHEISHFVFFDILRELNITLRNNPENRSLEHLFKEALTGALLSEPQMEELLEHKGYLGNPEVHNLYIKLADSEPLTLREYLRSGFRDYKARGLIFSDFIRDVIEKLLPHSTEFHQKKTFWDKNSQKMNEENPDLLEKYRQPIEI